ncbi:MAG: DUF5666 domain-containing protein [Anaerolineales bacterium]
MRIATIGFSVLSLVVPSAVFAEEEHPERNRFRYAGEIAGVVAGQGTFTLLTRAGEELEFQTSDRTHYRSPDGSVQDIHDLKKGMKALVAGIKDEGVLNALLVAAGNPEDRPDRPRFDLRVVGRVESKGDGSFTLLTRQGEQLTLKVTDDTHYKGIGSFGELAVGMHAAVGAKNTDGELVAIWVAARNAPEDRPRPEDRPGRNPEDRPDRRPDQAPDQDVEASA